MKYFQRTLRSVAYVCLALMLLGSLLAGCNSAGTAQPGVENGPVEEPTGESVGGAEATTVPPAVVQMPEYSLAYSGEMAEHIRTQELPEQNGLRFDVVLSVGQKTIFTLLFDQMEGELVTMLDTQSGEKLPVSFLMEPIPEGLSAEDELLFCTAQEQVNEIIASITLK